AIISLSMLTFNRDRQHSHCLKLIPPLMMLVYAVRFAVVDLGAGGDEFGGFFGHAGGEGFFFAQAFFGGEFAHLLCDLHRAEMRAAHRAVCSIYELIFTPI